MVRIYDTDTLHEMASKIYEKFEVMQSFCISGFVISDNDKLIAKGKIILDYIERRYKEENVSISSDGKEKKKYKFEKDSIGGPIAHKIFKWNIRVIDKEPRYTIWRLQ